MFPSLTFEAGSYLLLKYHQQIYYPAVILALVLRFTLLQGPAASKPYLSVSLSQQPLICPSRSRPSSIRHQSPIIPAAMSYTPDAGVMSSSLITFSIATTLVICRLVSRKITSVALWWDDYFCLTSWVSYLVLQIHDHTFLSSFSLSCSCLAR